MKTLLKWLLPLLIIAAVVAWFALRLRVEVVTGEATVGTAVNAVTGTVEIFASQDLTFRTERPGRLVEVPVSVGTEVKNGDPLGVQASARLDLRMANIRIRLESAEARLALRHPREFELDNLDREIEAARLAVELNQAPRSRLEQVKRERERIQTVYEAEKLSAAEFIDLLKNDLAQLQLEQDELTVRASFDGTVTEVFRFAGDYIGSGVAIARVIAPGRFGVLTLNEEDFFGVAKGQQVTVRLAGFPDRSFAGSVGEIGAVADASEKTRTLNLSIEDPEKLLVPGLTGEALLYKDIRDDAILVPRRALIGNRLYLVEDGRVRIREVQRGFVGIDRAEILSGLNAGETVILENQGLVREGMRVRTRAAR